MPFGIFKDPLGPVFDTFKRFPDPTFILLELLELSPYSHMHSQYLRSVNEFCTATMCFLCNRIHVLHAHKKLLPLEIVGCLRKNLLHRRLYLDTPLDFSHDLLLNDFRISLIH